MNESGVILGLSLGVGMGLTSARGMRSWREFWQFIVTILLILAAFALGVLALDTFGWMLPLRSYLTMWAVMLPTATLVGAVRLALTRRHAQHRQRRGLRPVAVEKRSSAHNRR